MRCVTAGRHVLCLCVVLIETALPVSGQVTYGADMAWHSRYEWRGLTIREGMVLQPDVYVSAGHEVTATMGVWTTIELTTPRTGEFGYGRTLFGESNVWAELATTLGPIDLAAGWNWYRFNARRAEHLPSGPLSTHELYGRAQILTLPIFVPRVDYYHDVDKAHGGFIEASLIMRVPLWNQVKAPVGSILLTGMTGYNISQDSIAGFERFRDRGFKYAEVDASTVTGYMPLSLFDAVRLRIATTLAFHLQFNVDPTTQMSKTGALRKRETWWTIGFQVSGPRCEPTRRIC